MNPISKNKFRFKSLFSFLAVLFFCFNIRISLMKMPEIKIILFSSAYAQTADYQDKSIFKLADILAKEEAIQDYYIMMIILVCVFISVILFILLFLRKTFLFKKWTKKNKEKASLSLNLLNDLALKRIKKGNFTRLKGGYQGKEITICRLAVAGFITVDDGFITASDGLLAIFEEAGILISAPFHDPNSPPKSKYITMSRSYFHLQKKGGRGIKWNSFEDAFKISTEIDQLLNEKTKSNLKLLFCSGYFDHAINTNLTIWPSYCNKDSVDRKMGKVVFKLPISILKDVKSSKIAMDVVAEVAKKMDKIVINYGPQNLNPMMLRK